ncbi:MAG TPA: metal-dependent transcriptional regulator [Gemmatimonadales bacterium]|nr:metal-dependent transcriptional regulator [Gemmatimonadales bacterium]
MSASLAHEPLTRSVEDYLKAIYHLTLAGEAAATSDIAQQLELSAPSVSGMIKRLSEQGLLEHEPYRGVQLTSDGRRLALRMVRRHRILEAYLVGFLGYGWENVHAEAERLEHAVSDKLIERMASALGNPRVDPHGDPIPAPDGTVAEMVYTALPEIPEGETVEIRRVDTGQPDKLRYIAGFGLTPGARARMVDRQPFHGPITVEVAGRRHVLGDEIARLILCARPEVSG